MDCYREGSVNVLLLLEARPTSVASIQTHDGGVSHNMAGHVIVHYMLNSHIAQGLLSRCSTKLQAAVWRTS